MILTYTRVFASSLYLDKLIMSYIISSLYLSSHAIANFSQQSHNEECYAKKIYRGTSLIILNKTTYIKIFVYLCIEYTKNFHERLYINFISSGTCSNIVMKITESSGYKDIYVSEKTTFMTEITRQRNILYYSERFKVTTGLSQVGYFLFTQILHGKVLWHASVFNPFFKDRLRNWEEYKFSVLQGV